MTSRIDRCYRQIFFISDPVDPDWPIELGGSCILAKANGKLCLITARHCIEKYLGKNNGKRVIGVIRQCGEQGLIRFDHLHYIKDTDFKDGYSDGRLDLAVITQDHPNGTSEDALNVVDGLNVLYDPMLKIGSAVTAFGFPEGLGMPYSNKRYSYKFSGVMGNVVNMEYKDLLITVIIHAVVDSNKNEYDINSFNYNGLSGSAVFHYPENIGGSLFSGIVLSCGGGLLRYLSSKVIVDFIRKEVISGKCECG